MSGRVGIVGFSFALRGEDEEPNPCNVRLAKAVERIAFRNSGSVTVVQWEIDRQLVIDGVAPSLVVHRPLDGTYLDSEGVWEAAKKVFEREHIKVVIPVAQPFLHLTKIRMMIRADNYTVLKWRVGWIGFDNDRRNTQWWCKGPIRLTLYAIRQALFGSKGK